ncbi:transcription factor [Fusarium mexicanum]|uniref:Transcription factor n=1 Tax=Fusarium mexicanum TaxID=751941 RepID=A0A8H5N5B0_9HYPO|nr:transcription factor [Fusarium mexicanum]
MRALSATKSGVRPRLSQQAATAARARHSQRQVSEASVLNSEAVILSSQTRNFGPDDGLWSSPAARPPQGFFGPTSFPAAYQETEASLAAQEPAMAVVDTPSSPTIPAPPSVAEIQSIVNMDQGASQLAVKVLQALPEKPLMYRSKPQVGLDEDWLASIGDRLLTSTWEIFGSHLSDRANTAKLREMGSRICINTRKTLREDQDDPSAWIESFSGANLRWEAVGVMFLHTALSELSIASNEESKRIITYYTEYCASCITLANMGGSSGTLMLFLMYKRSVLHAWVHGETSLPYWKFHAETVAMLTFSGLHDNRSSTNVASIPTEIRRRIRCQVFIVDKFLATFAGRPPLLTRRFCFMNLPLDLEESRHCRYDLDLYKQLPQHLAWDATAEEIIEIDLEIAYPRLLIRLDHLLNMFLIQRLLVKHGQARNELLRTSFEMVVLTLNFWAQKNIWAALQGKCRWIIMGYATLAGAVLCMELIDPVAVNMSPEDSIIACETYSRSSIIQQLSLLLGYLKTSCPSQTHCSVAHNARGVIKKVLDHILNNPTLTQPVVELGELDFAGGWDHFSSFSVLDNFDWLMEERVIEETSGLL